MTATPETQVEHRSDWPLKGRNVRILIGAGTCGIAAGAGAVWAAAEEALAEYGLPVPVIGVGCIGCCQEEPLLDIEIDGERWSYRRVTPESVRQILSEHLWSGQPVPKLLLGKVSTGATPFPELPFYTRQVRIATRNCGFIDPTSLGDYEARGGYQALRKVLGLLPGAPGPAEPEAIIAEVKRSGLRGRGGAGFLTGLKWEFTRKGGEGKRYLICNADEGDPGAFMDRSILEGDPHAVIEGMIIGAYAQGADEGYIYCRAEYPLAVERLQGAIRAAEEAGYLGDRILGTHHRFHLHLKEGAGAFVCGEETALMASIEGQRGTPRPKPPFPSVSGLWGRPTTINNVESWANIAQIIMNGGDWYAAMGTERSKGTKVFALTGRVNRTGLVEVPMGMSIRQIVYEMGGGIPDDKELKAVQMGGPSGGCIPAHLLDLPVDYESLTAAGAIMGSGGMVVVDETTCMVDFARFFMSFCAAESCGKCTPCREGTTRMLEILERITRGEAGLADLDRLERLAQNVKVSSLCQLGGSAPNPVLSALTHFRAEFEAHIVEKRCPAGACPALLSYAIDPDRCTGCMLCARNCPVNAIAGEKRKPHVIDPMTCIKCGACFDLCRFDAVKR